jgi:hypothetical protein
LGVAFSAWLGVVDLPQPHRGAESKEAEGGDDWDNRRPQAEGLKNATRKIGEHFQKAEELGQKAKKTTKNRRRQSDKVAATNR